jgi:hypothetical protein
MELQWRSLHLGRVNTPFKLPFSLMRNKSLFQVINSTNHSEEGSHGPRNFALATWCADPDCCFADPSVLALNQFGAARRYRRTLG